MLNKVRALIETFPEVGAFQRFLSRVVFFQHLTALLSSSHGPSPSKGNNTAFPSPQVPTAIKPSQLLMLLGYFLAELVEMDLWISKVIPGGSQVTHRDGLIPSK